MVRCSRVSGAVAGRIEASLIARGIGIAYRLFIIDAGAGICLHTTKAC